MIISRVIYPRQVVAKIPFGVNETIYISALPTVNIRSKVLYILISGSTFTQHVYDGGWIAGSGGGGSSVHNDLTGKDALNQHPASAITGLVAALADKVDKVTGKELSSNDYTDTEKTKLSNIADGAEVNVNADWSSTSGDSEILNKPTIIAQTDVSITIAVADWSGGTTCTKTVTGITTTSDNDVVIPTVTDRDNVASFGVWAKKVITVNGQQDFTCDSTPDAAITLILRIKL